MYQKTLLENQWGLNSNCTCKEKNLRFRLRRYLVCVLCVVSHKYKSKKYPTVYADGTLQCTSNTKTVLWCRSTAWFRSITSYHLFGGDLNHQTNEDIWKLYIFLFIEAPLVQWNSDINIVVDDSYSSIATQSCTVLWFKLPGTSFFAWKDCAIINRHKRRTGRIWYEREI